MLGAIVGDIIGSVYEGKKKWLLERTPHFQPLFSPKGRFTDDTVLTVALADSLLNGGHLPAVLKDYYSRYPTAGFGREFERWAASDDEQPYGSWGNGSAMRVSPVASAFDTFREVLQQAKESARVTHNHPEGIRGAQATAAAIYLARSGASKQELKAELEGRFQYDLSFTLDAVRPGYVFDASCQGTVPTRSSRSSSPPTSRLRLAISLGGDCDTLACLAGSIAAAHYDGVPGEIRKRALSYLDDSLLEIVREFERRFPLSAAGS